MDLRHRRLMLQNNSLLYPHNDLTAAGQTSKCKQEIVVTKHSFGCLNNATETYCILSCCCLCIINCIWNILFQTLHYYHGHKENLYIFVCNDVYLMYIRAANTFCFQLIYNLLIVLSIKCDKHSWVPRARGDVLTWLVLSDQQSKIQRYSTSIMTSDTGKH